ncbi:hypothetical protein [Hydrogenophaga sp.]|uniref:beta strand repeat-containing protein n=1 Tax=Hydrogenophaga sp. TaxID=1904254 RepID=UPI002624C554|nr:hypothetical protein [Hydrogenophaga sp.]
MLDLQTKIDALEVKVDSNTASTAEILDDTNAVGNTSGKPTTNSIAGLKAALDALASAADGDLTALTDRIADLEAGLDSAAPAITGVTITASNPDANGAYGAGDVVRVEVAFDESVLVRGAPSFALKVGDKTVQAILMAGAGTDKLVFEYTLTASDIDADGISAVANALQLNGGAVTDAARNESLATSAPVLDSSSLKVDNGPLSLSFTAGAIFGSTFTASSVMLGFIVDAQTGPTVGPDPENVVFLSDLDENGSFDVPSGSAYIPLDLYFLAISANGGPDFARLEEQATFGPQSITPDFSGSIAFKFGGTVAGIFKPETLAALVSISGGGSLSPEELAALIAANTVPAESVLLYDGANAGETIAQAFLDAIQGRDPADVQLTVTSPLTVAQAAALVEAGFDLANNVVYALRDYDTTVTAAMLLPGTATVVRGATQVTAIGDELANAMRFTSFDQRVNLRVEAQQGDDRIDAGRGNDEIVGGVGADTINLTSVDNSRDAVIYQTINDGQSLPVSTVTFSTDPQDYRPGSVLTVTINGVEYSHTVTTREGDVLDAGTVKTELDAFAASIAALTVPVDNSSAVVAYKVSLLDLINGNGVTPVALTMADLDANGSYLVPADHRVMPASSLLLLSGALNSLSGTMLPEEANSLVTSVLFGIGGTGAGQRYTTDSSLSLYDTNLIPGNTGGYLVMATEQAIEAHIAAKLAAQQVVPTIAPLGAAPDPITAADLLVYSGNVLSAVNTDIGTLRFFGRPGQKLSVLAGGDVEAAIENPGLATVVTVDFSSTVADWPTATNEGNTTEFTRKLSVTIDGITINADVVFDRDGTPNPVLSVAALKTAIEAENQVGGDIAGKLASVNGVTVDGTTLTLTGATAPVADAAAPTFKVDAASVDQNGVQQVSRVEFSTDDTDYYEGGTLSVEIAGQTISADMVAGDAAASVGKLVTAVKEAALAELESVAQSTTIGEESQVAQAYTYAGGSPSAVSYSLNAKGPLLVAVESVIGGGVSPLIFIGSFGYKVDSSLKRITGEFINENSADAVTEARYVQFDNVEALIASIKLDGSPTGTPLTDAYDVTYVDGVLRVAVKSGGIGITAASEYINIGASNILSSGIVFTAATEATDPLLVDASMGYQGEQQQATLTLETGGKDGAYDFLSDGNATERGADVHFSGGKAYVTITDFGINGVLGGEDDVSVTVEALMGEDAAATNQNLVDAINERINGVPEILEPSWSAPVSPDPTLSKLLSKATLGEDGTITLTAKEYGKEAFEISDVTLDYQGVKQIATITLESTGNHGTTFVDGATTDAGTSRGVGIYYQGGKVYATISNADGSLSKTVSAYMAGPSVAQINGSNKVQTLTGIYNGAAGGDGVTVYQTVQFQQGEETYRVQFFAEDRAGNAAPQTASGFSAAAKLLGGSWVVFTGADETAKLAALAADLGVTSVAVNPDLGSGLASLTITGPLDFVEVSNAAQVKYTTDSPSNKTFNSTSDDIRLTNGTDPGAITGDREISAATATQNLTDAINAAINGTDVAIDPLLSQLLQGAEVINGSIVLTAKDAGKDTFEVTDVALDYQGQNQIATATYSTDGEDYYDGGTLSITIDTTPNLADGTAGDVTVTQDMVAAGATVSLQALVDKINAGAQSTEATPAVITIKRDGGFSADYQNFVDVPNSGIPNSFFAIDSWGIDVRDTDISPIPDFQRGSGYFSVETYSQYWYGNSSGLQTEFKDLADFLTYLEANFAVTADIDLLTGDLVITSTSKGSNVVIDFTWSVSEYGPGTQFISGGEDLMFEQKGLDGAYSSRLAGEDTGADGVQGIDPGVTATLDEATGTITLISKEKTEHAFNISKTTISDPGAVEVTEVTFSTTDADYFTQAIDADKTPGKVSLTVDGKTYTVNMLSTAESTLSALETALNEGQPLATPAVLAIDPSVVTFTRVGGKFTFTGVTDGDALGITATLSEDAVQQVTDITFDAGFDDSSLIAGIGREVSVTVAGQMFKLDGDTRLELLQDLKTQLDDAIAADTVFAGIGAKLATGGVVLDEANLKLTLTAKYGGVDPLSVSDFTRAGFDEFSGNNVKQQLELGLTNQYLDSLLGSGKTLTFELGKTTVTYTVTNESTRADLANGIATVLGSADLVEPPAIETVSGRIFITVTAAFWGPNVLGTVSNGLDNTVRLQEGLDPDKILITTGFSAQELAAGSIEFLVDKDETVASADATVTAGVAVDHAVAVTPTPTTVPKDVTQEAAGTITNVADDADFFGDSAITGLSEDRTLLGLDQDFLNPGNGRGEDTDGNATFFGDDPLTRFASSALGGAVKAGQSIEVTLTTVPEVLTQVDIAVVFSVGGATHDFEGSANTSSMGDHIAALNVLLSAFEITKGVELGSFTFDALSKTVRLEAAPDVSISAPLDPTVPLFKYAAPLAPTYSLLGNGSVLSDVALWEPASDVFVAKITAPQMGTILQTHTNPDSGYEATLGSPQANAGGSNAGQDGLFGSNPGTYTDAGLDTTYLNGDVANGNGIYDYGGPGNPVDSLNIGDGSAVGDGGTAGGAAGAFTDSTAGEDSFDVTTDQAGIAPFTWDSSVLTVRSTGSSVADVVNNFQTAYDWVELEAALLHSTVDGAVEAVQAAESIFPFGPVALDPGQVFNLSTTEFGLVGQMQSSVSVADLDNSTAVSDLLNRLFNFDVLSEFGGTSDNGTLNTTVFAVTASDNANVTAIWAHTQSTTGDNTVETYELNLLATLNTSGNEFGINNFLPKPDLLLPVLLA